MLVNLTHRGACGCDPETGDGAGLLVQLPHEFFRKEAQSGGFALPAPGEYGAGMVFLSAKADERRAAQRMVNEVVEREGQKVLGWREVPTNSRTIGWLARESEPSILQVFIGKGDGRRAARRCLGAQAVHHPQIDRERGETARAGRVITPLQCRRGRFATRACCWRRRSSNTTGYGRLRLQVRRRSRPTSVFRPTRFPPGNARSLSATWRTTARSIPCAATPIGCAPAKPTLQSEYFGADTEKIKPIIDENGSDSTQIDNALELLIQSGRSTAHSFMMLIPEAWSSHEHMEDYKKAF